MEMHKSIANDNLYSDRGSNALHAGDDKSNADDSWYDDVSLDDKSNRTTSDMDREWQNRRDHFHTIGYRDGLIAGKEAIAQEGFNIGFKDSVFTAYGLGLVRGVSSAMACLPGGIKEKLVENEETRDEFWRLHESVQSLSTTDAMKLLYEDRESKDDGVLENYKEQLRLLISESPLVQVQFDMN